MNIATLSHQMLQEYQALREGAALQLRAAGGVLRLAGEDRVDFLQRMTTNNIAALGPNQATVTVLTSPVARIEHVFTVIARPEDLWLLPTPGTAEALALALRGKIFFMDKVTVDDLSAELARLRLMGPQAGPILEELNIDLAGAGDGQWLEQDGIFVMKQDAYDVPGFELIVPQDRLNELSLRIEQAGAVSLQSDAAYHIRRIELGRPAPGRELTGEYNPLEAGLAWTCADDKGCYTGQEIIARQVTYDKVTKTLVGLRGDKLLEAGSQVHIEDRVVGQVTSSAYSPTLDAHIALAVLKRPFNQAGTKVLVNGQPAVVMALPMCD